MRSEASKQAQATYSKAKGVYRGHPGTKSELRETYYPLFRAAYQYHYIASGKDEYYAHKKSEQWLDGYFEHKGIYFD